MYRNSIIARLVGRVRISRKSATGGSRADAGVRPTWSSLVGFCVALILGMALYGQKPFREYPGWEYSDFPVPEDWRVPGEWAFARLMYPPIGGGYNRRRRANVDWREGYSNWTIDYPRSDRHLLEGVRRLTRIDSRRSVTTLKLTQKRLRTLASATWPEVEHHAASRPAILPQVSLMVPSSSIVHLHIHRSFIRLNITAAQ